MTARTPMTCARISLATCAILLACAARRVKRIACVRYSSCMSRFTIAVRCCPAGCACCPMGTLCAGCAVLCAALSRAGICLFCLLAGVLVCSGVRRGAAVLLSGLLVYCLRLQLCASCSATCCYCPTAFTVCRLSVLRSAIRHPFGARSNRLRRARSAYLAILITIVAFIII